MVWKEVVQHNYAVLSESVQTKVVEVAHKAEATAKALTNDAVSRAESAARAAATVPQEVVVSSLQKVERMGNQTLANIDAVRLKTKELESFGKDDETLASSEDISEFSRSRNDVWLLFDNPTSSLKAYLIYLVLLIFILLTTAIYVVESIPAYCCGRYSEIWLPVDTTTILFFTGEYLIRFIVAPPWVILKDDNLVNPTFADEISTRLRFFLSPINLIDFLSIAPFYVSLIYPDSDSTAKPVMMVLRMLRIFRLFRLSRSTEGMVILSRTISTSYRALGMLCYFMLIAVILFSSIMFLIERGHYFYCTTEAASQSPALCDVKSVGNYTHTEGSALQECAQWVSESMGVDYGSVICCSGETWYISPALDDNGDGCADTSQFSSIIITAWWAMVSMTTVGYGDMVPRTSMGKMLGSVVMLSGIVILALPITVIGSSFQQQEKKYHEECEKQKKQEILRKGDSYCPICVSVNGGPWPHTEAQCPQAGVSASADFWRTAPPDLQAKREAFLSDPAFAAVRVKFLPRRGRIISSQRSVIDSAPTTPRTRTPDGVPACGSDRQRRRVRVEVCQGRNLPKMDTLGSCDAFVRASLGTQSWTTGVAANAYHAKWNFPIDLDLCHGEEDTMLFEVFDKDTYPGAAPKCLTEQFIGTCKLELRLVVEELVRQRAQGPVSKVLTVFSKCGSPVEGHNRKRTELAVAVTLFDALESLNGPSGAREPAPLSPSSGEFIFDTHAPSSAWPSPEVSLASAPAEGLVTQGKQMNGSGRNRWDESGHASSLTPIPVAASPTKLKGTEALWPAHPVPRQRPVAAARACGAVRGWRQEGPVRCSLELIPESSRVLCRLPCSSRAMLADPRAANSSSPTSGVGDDSSLGDAGVRMVQENVRALAARMESLEAKMDVLLQAVATLGAGQAAGAHPAGAAECNGGRAAGRG